MNKEAVIEGLLFVSGEDGLSLKEMARVLEVGEEEVKATLTSLLQKYQDASRGIQIEQFGKVYKLVTKKEHKEFYEKLFDAEKEDTLSVPCLEVLAIVAYNTPVTRSMVDEIRGVSSSHLMRKLLSKNLIEVTGKSDLPGRPNLYGVTNRFLDYFGLSSLEELPKMEMEENTEETDLYHAKYQENIEILEDI